MLSDGLIGAAIGAAAAIAAQWFANRHTTVADRRREKIELASRFWAASDRLWEATKSLGFTVYEIQASREAKHLDRLPELDAQRLSEIAHIRQAESELRLLHAQIRLIYPDLAWIAEDVRRASSVFKIEDGGSNACVDARQVALDAFEKVVAEDLALADRE